MDMWRRGTKNKREKRQKQLKTTSKSLIGTNPKAYIFFEGTLKHI